MAARAGRQYAVGWGSAMSSDGQISVSVNAEGTEDAVGQLGDNAVAEQQAAGNQAAAEVQQVEAIPGGAMLNAGFSCDSSTPRIISI